MAKILVIDEPKIAESFQDMLDIYGYEADVAYSEEEGWNKIQQHYYHVIILGDTGSKSKLLAKRLIERDVNLKIIVVTPYGDEKTPIDWLHCHVFDCFKKPVDNTTLMSSVKSALEHYDPIIEALEDGVEDTPIDANRPIRIDIGGKRVLSEKQILDEIKRNTSFGRKEYKNLIKLTVDLLTRGKLTRGKIKS